jgi:hypothetical protein
LIALLVVGGSLLAWLILAGVQNDGRDISGLSSALNQS